MFLGPTTTVPGVGRTRSGVITTVPDELVPELLATGNWQPLAGGAEPERVTEVPATAPAAKPRAAKRSTRR